jgi:hypothetical protein
LNNTFGVKTGVKTMIFYATSRTTCKLWLVFHFHEGKVLDERIYVDHQYAVDELFS